MFSAERVWVPTSACTSTSAPGPQGSGCFLANGTGLAAGNHMLEAVSHALCEVVERDAFALWGDRTAADRASRHVDLESVDDPGCRVLIDACEAAGVGVVASTSRPTSGCPSSR